MPLCALRKNPKQVLRQQVVHPQTSLSCWAWQTSWGSVEGRFPQQPNPLCGTSPGYLPSRSIFCMPGNHQHFSLGETSFKYLGHILMLYRMWCKWHLIKSDLSEPRSVRMNAEKGTLRSVGSTQAGHSRGCTGTLSLLGIKQFPEHKKCAGGDQPHILQLNIP